MYFSYLERLIIKLRNAGKKYPFFKPVFFLARLCLRFLIFIKKSISGNVKKIASVGALITMCFVLCPEVIFGENFEDITHVNTGSSEAPVMFLGNSVDLDNEAIEANAAGEADSSKDINGSADYTLAYSDDNGSSVIGQSETLIEDKGTDRPMVDVIPYGEAENIPFSKDDWNLILINKQHPMPDDYDVELADISKGMKCDARILDSLKAMIRGAGENNINIIVCSPYRSRKRQESLFKKKIQTYMKTGKTYLEAYSFASTAVTIPGSSEHEAGLAVDLISSNYSRLNAGFADTAAGQWLAEHSWEYGFTLRYPKEKEYITGIEYEPWHFRYVGLDAAKYMKEHDICLEELVEKLK